MSKKKTRIAYEKFINNPNPVFIESNGKAWYGHGKEAQLIKINRYWVTSKTYGRTIIEAFTKEEAVKIALEDDNKEVKKNGT
jgi:hypothetical protein